MEKLRSITFYVIRQKATGFLLPAGGKGLGGHTKQEPSGVLPPRLFEKEKFAKAALKCWLAGRWFDSYSKDWETGYSECDGPEPRKVETRIPGDMEVVPCELRMMDRVIEYQQVKTINDELRELQSK